MTETSALVPVATNLPALPTVDVFAQFAGQGFENVGMSDMLIPRLVILQALSPQAQSHEAAYIEGAKVGNIIDTATREVMPQPLSFLPVYYRKDWLEWAPRNTGGLVSIHATADVLRNTRKDENGHDRLPNGNRIVETAQMFGLNMSANTRACYIAFTSTQIKKVKQWLSMANAEVIEVNGAKVQPPLFFRTYSLGTAVEGNTKGKWAGWTIARGKTLMETPDWGAVMKRVAELRSSLQSGAAQGDTTDFDPATGEVVM